MSIWKIFSNLSLENGDYEKRPSKENNISLMTVKHVVDDLIEAKILLEKDSCNSDVGRNPKVLEIAENYGISCA